MALLLLLDPFHLYLLLRLLLLHPWFPFPIHVSCPIPKWANVFKVFTAASLKAPVAIYFHFCLRIEGSRRRRQTPDKQAGVGMRGCRDGVLPVGCRAAGLPGGCLVAKPDGHLADALTTSHFCFIFITFLFVAAVAVLIALVVAIVAGINLFCLVSKEYTALACLPPLPLFLPCTFPFPPS